MSDIFDKLEEEANRDVSTRKEDMDQVILLEKRHPKRRKIVRRCDACEAAPRMVRTKSEEFIPSPNIKVATIKRLITVYNTYRCPSCNHEKKDIYLSPLSV